VSRRPTATFLVGIALTLASCSGGQPTATVPIPSGAVLIRAVNTTFQPAALNAPGQSFTLYFDNADSVSHNVALLGADGSRGFAGDIFSGPGQKVYNVSGLASGTYKLHCDVHPEMGGTLTVP
jgi:plastocyanin